MTDMHWDTSITKVAETEILVRGYPIGELMNRLTYSEVVWLVLMGEVPDENLSKLLNAVLVSTIDHSAAPPSCITARTLASTGAPLNTAVAGGLTAMNKFHGGAIEGCFRALNEAVRYSLSNDVAFDVAAEAIVKLYKSEKRKIAGFGHLLHTTDPRTVALFELADKLGLAGDHVGMAKAFENYFVNSGKRLILNINGATGAVLGDLGVPPEMMNGFFMISRVPGLIAHVIEEKSTQKPMRKIDPTGYRYTGSSERELE